MHGIALLAAARKVPVLVTWEGRDVTEDLGESVIRLGFKTELAEKEITNFGFSELNFKNFGYSWRSNSLLNSLLKLSGGTKTVSRRACSALKIFKRP